MLMQNYSNAKQSKSILYLNKYEEGQCLGMGAGYIVLRITIDKIITIDERKYNATNLRLSAFICGLNKSQNTWQPGFMIKSESFWFFLSFFINPMSALKNVNLRMDLR